MNKINYEKVINDVKGYLELNGDIEALKFLNKAINTEKKKAVEVAYKNLLEESNQLKNELAISEMEKELIMANEYIDSLEKNNHWYSGQEENTKSSNWIYNKQYDNYLRLEKMHNGNETIYVYTDIVAN
jgi:hypothetical protein